MSIVQDVIVCGLCFGAMTFTAHIRDQLKNVALFLYLTHQYKLWPSADSMPVLPLLPLGVATLVLLHSLPSLSSAWVTVAAVAHCLGIPHCCFAMDQQFKDRTNKNKKQKELTEDFEL